MVLPFWYRLTRVVPDKGPLNRCVCVCVRACVYVFCLLTLLAAMLLCSPMGLTHYAFFLGRATPRVTKLLCTEFCYFWYFLNRSLITYSSYTILANTINSSLCITFSFIIISNSSLLTQYARNSSICADCLWRCLSHGVVAGGYVFTECVDSAAVQMRRRPIRFD